MKNNKKAFDFNYSELHRIWESWQSNPEGRRFGQYLIQQYAPGYRWPELYYENSGWRAYGMAASKIR